jgi:RIO kinase 1
MDLETFEKKFWKKQERLEKDAEQRKIEKEVFDEFTANAVYKLALRKEIDLMYYCVSTGKEGNVFRASVADGGLRAVKVYRVETSDFRTMWKYIEGDRRFKNVKKDRRSIVLTWCRKEFSNLKLAEEAGASVPKPYAFQGNVLVMGFIGKEWAAPQLREIELKSPERLFWAIMEDAKKLYENGLIHSDLSEYNVLVHEGKHHLIDIGQGVLRSHPLADEFLKRDISNMVNFFRKRGAEVNDEEALEFVKGERGGHGC